MGTEWVRVVPIMKLIRRTSPPELLKLCSYYLRVITSNFAVLTEAETVAAVEGNPSPYRNHVLKKKKTHNIYLQEVLVEKNLVGYFIYV